MLTVRGEEGDAKLTYTRQICSENWPKAFARILSVSTFREESDTSGSSTSSGFLASNLGGRRQEQEEAAAPQRQKEGEGSRGEDEEREVGEGDEEVGGQKADRRKQPTPVKNKSAPVPPVKQVARKSTAAVKVL